MMFFLYLKKCSVLSNLSWIFCSQAVLLLCLGCCTVVFPIAANKPTAALIYNSYKILLSCFQLSKIGNEVILCSGGTNFSQRGVRGILANTVDHWNVGRICAIAPGNGG